MKKKKRNTIRRILPILLAVLMTGLTLPAGTLAEGLSDAGALTAAEYPANGGTVFSSGTAEEMSAAGELPQDATEDRRLLYADTHISPEQLYKLDFSSKRILVGTEDPDIFTDPSVVVSSYKNTYLLQFPDEATARAAYAYYFERADFIEADTGIEAAQPEEALQTKEDSPVVTETFMTGDANPFRELQTQLEEDRAAEETALANGEDPQQPVYDIALIDTGVPADAGVDAISLIGEDPADDNGHGSGMLERIREQNPEASVLSVKALDKDGKGDISAVYAAMEYAMEKNVRIINLSMSAAASPDNCILEQAVALAKEKGILVVGAAGNNGKDAKYYIPGSIAEAWIIGACDAEGVRLANSNFGATVDCNVAASSTSDAAAVFSGWLSVHGEDMIPSVLGQGLIFPADAAGDPAKSGAPVMEDEDFRAAYHFIVSDVTELQGYDYYINPGDVGLGNPNMIFTNTLTPGYGYFELAHNQQIRNWTNGQLDSPMHTSVIYRSPVNVSPGHYNIPWEGGSGGFELRWPEAAKSASGVGYDVILSVWKIEVETAAQEPGNRFLVMSGGPTSTTWQTHVMDGMNLCPTGLKVWYTIMVTRPGTYEPAPGTFYFGAQDIDQPDHYHWAVNNIAAHGDYWNHGGAWSEPGAYFHYNYNPFEYTESFAFLSAPASPIYFQSGTPLQNVNGERFYATWYDSSPGFWTGFVCKAPCSGIVMGWSGSDCGSAVFVGTPGSYNIKAWVEGDIGGQITKNGYTYYYPGQNSNYQMTPDPGWEIEYVKVDGMQIPTTPSFDFNNIQANHTICVKYRNTAGKLTVKKVVTGNMGNRMTAFHFRLHLSNQNVNPADAVITYKKTLQDGTVQNGNVILINGDYDFTLAHEEEMEFSGIPGSTSYTVTETDADTDQYVTTVAGAATGSLTGSISVQFTNRRQMAIPTKAKVLTIGSVVFMFALVAASGTYIVFSLKKKKKGSE